MLLRTVYTLAPTTPGVILDLNLPLSVPFAEEVQGILSLDNAGNVRLVMERRVDPSALELVTNTGRSRKLPDGSEESIPALRLHEDEPPDHVFATDVVSAISFLTDAPLRLSGSLDEDRFVSENDADRKRLQELGTDEADYVTFARVEVRSFDDVPITAERIQGLVARRAGLRLYADALKLSSGVAQFRELWRVLESAFGIQDKELVTALVTYPPTQDMSFDGKELRELLILRNRASHAASKGGLRELVTVERDCFDQLPRLKNLVERVILTKRSWGYRTQAIQALLPLGNYVRPITGGKNPGAAINHGKR